jgi:hypothetical protein
MPAGAADARLIRTRMATVVSSKKLLDHRKLSNFE